VRHHQRGGLLKSPAEREKDQGDQRAKQHRFPPMVREAEGLRPIDLMLAQEPGDEDQTGALETQRGYHHPPNGDARSGHSGKLLDPHAQEQTGVSAYHPDHQPARDILERPGFAQNQRHGQAARRRRRQGEEQFGACLSTGAGVMLHAQEQRPGKNADDYA
jgi:hypothetical protein